MRAEQESAHEQGGHLLSPQLLFSPDNDVPAQAPKALPELSAEERKEWLDALKGTRGGHPGRGNRGKDVWPLITESPPIDPGSSGGPICGLEKFEFPECWYEHKRSGKWTFGFKVHLKYMPEPKPTYACECCVFRQLIHKFSVLTTESGTVKSSENDKPHRVDWAPRSGSEFQAGGERPDGSKRGDKDKPEEGIPHGGGWINTPCELCYTDTPELGKIQEGSFDLRMEFVGLVFDRCRNWLLIAAKRFVWSRSGYYRRSAEGKLQVVSRKGSGEKVTVGLGPGAPGKNMKGKAKPKSSASACKCG